MAESRSEGILDQFNHDGFMVFEDLFNPAEVDEMLNAAKSLSKAAPKEDRVMFHGTDPESCRKRDQFLLDSANKISYFYRVGVVDENNELLVPEEFALNRVGHTLAVDNSVFKKYTFDNRIRELCWQLGMKKPGVAQSMVIFKNPGVGGSLVSHQDSTFILTDPPSTVGFWIALEDTTVENGCLHFIKGSHKNGIHRRYIRNSDKDSKELLIYDRSEPMYQQSGFIACPVKKGTLVIIHNAVVHGSAQNKSQVSRNAYTFHVVETKDTVYSPDNWLQPSTPFPILYEK